MDSMTKDKGNYLHKYDPLRNRCIGKNKINGGNGLERVLLFIFEEKEALSKIWQM